MTRADFPRVVIGRADVLQFVDFAMDNDELLSQTTMLSENLLNRVSLEKAEEQ